MPSIERITERDQVAEQHRHHYDAIVASRGAVGASLLLPAAPARTGSAHSASAGIRPFRIGPADRHQRSWRSAPSPGRWTASTSGQPTKTTPLHPVSDRKLWRPSNIVADLQGLSKGEDAAIVEFVRQLLRPPHRISRRNLSRRSAAQAGGCPGCRTGRRHRSLRRAGLFTQRLRCAAPRRPARSAHLGAARSEVIRECSARAFPITS